MNRKQVIFFQGFVFLLFFCTCVEAQTIKIGINAPITGDLPEIGEGTKAAAKQWLMEVVRSGGIVVGGNQFDVELVIEDNESKAESAVKANTKMITEDEVLIIVGPQSSRQAVPSGQTANDYDTPMISLLATHPATNAGRPYVFRMSPSGVRIGMAIAGYVRENLGFRRGAILYPKESGGYLSSLKTSFQSSWEKHFRPRSITAYELDSSPAGSNLRDLIRSDPDFVFVPFFMRDSSVVRAIRQAGWRKPIIIGDTWNQQVLKGCQHDCGELYLTTSYTTMGDRGGNRSFVREYNRETGHDPNEYAAITTDALNIAKKAIQKCGRLTNNITTDRACVRDALTKVSYSGLTGTTAFSQSGNPNKSLTIIKIDASGNKSYHYTCPQDYCNCPEDCEVCSECECDDCKCDDTCDCEGCS